MNVLIVEDEAVFSNAVEDELRKLELEVKIWVVCSQEAANKLIEDEFFDLIILDLKIPTHDNAANEAVNHGIAVFTNAKAIAPGTPILVLTGSSADEHIEVIVNHSERKDVWGEGRSIPIVDFLKKHRLGELPEKLVAYANSLRGVLEVEVTKNDCQLSLSESRIIRIFARNHKAGRCVVSQIGGGLSVAKVFRINVLDRQGNTIHDAICKIGPIEKIYDESYRYDRYISRLNQIATPRKLIDLYYGAKNTGGVFYGLAQGFVETGFDLLKKDTAAVRETIAQLEGLFSPWAAGESRKSIADLRRRVIGDEDFNNVRPLLGFQWLDSFERQEIQTRWCCTHGDLHGLNVLVSSMGVPILIDYGDVEEGAPSLDPITLELAMLFHPQGPLRGNAWPTLEQAKYWGDSERYLVGCPNPDFVLACRQWSKRAAPGDREVAACAYSYLVRQLKYDGQNVELIRALIEGAKRMYDEA